MVKTFRPLLDPAAKLDYNFNQAKQQIKNRDEILYFGEWVSSLSFAWKDALVFRLCYNTKHKGEDKSPPCGIPRITGYLSKVRPRTLEEQEPNNRQEEDVELLSRRTSSSRFYCWEGVSFSTETPPFREKTTLDGQPVTLRLHKMIISSAPLTVFMTKYAELITKHKQVKTA